MNAGPVCDQRSTGLHCDGYRFSRLEGLEANIVAEDVAEWIRVDPRYDCGKIRLLACSAGKYDDGAAQEISDILGVEVLAPTEDLYINYAGEYNVAKTKTLSDMIFVGEAIEVDGWRSFYPRGNS